MAVDAFSFPASTGPSLAVTGLASGIRACKWRPQTRGSCSAHARECWTPDSLMRWGLCVCYRTNYDSLDTVTELIACFIVPQACSSRVFEPPLVLVHTVHVSKVGHPNT